MPPNFVCSRHRVNLQNNLLEVPDEYWDHEELESLFLATTQYALN